MEEKALAFLKTLKPGLCVFSTASSDGKPEAAVVGFAVQNDLSVIINTHLNTRKAQNVLKNNKVAVVFGWSFDGLNIQYEGVAKVVKEGEEYSRLNDIYYAQQPETKKFHGADSIYIAITPKWLRITDLTVHPWSSEEKMLL
jgi:pyridoxine/pyridoxamine 5'-phosphate oxidase